MSSNGGNALAALLPDGRLWVDCIWYDSGRRILCFGELPGFQLGTKWLSLSGNQILPGSNWVAVVANFRNTVAVRSDGTLWVPETPRQGYSDQGEPAGPPPIEPGAPLVRFGEETNWQVVVHDITYESFAAVLLKTDGTLWRWSPNRPVARNAFNGLRSFEPHRLGSDSDWARLQAVGAVVYCWKRDGQAWALHRPPHIPGQNQAVPEPPVDVVTVITRVPGLDNFNFRSVAHLGGLHVAVRDDGTLWSWDIRPPKGPWDGLNFSPRPPVQLGHETDWSSVAGEWRSLSALKTDGSLWQWQFSDVWAADTKLGRRAPVRLGRHNDWVALSDVFGNTVSLAADGSLWYWWYRSPGVAESDQPLLAPSRRPSRLENILAAGGSM
jgi:hypothetical protein